MRAAPDLGDWVRGASARLAPQSDSAGLEVQVVAAWALDKTRTWVSAHPEYRLTPVELMKLNGLFFRLLNGEPLAYIRGFQEFYRLKIKVSPAVLIPRPETELLVDCALAWLRLHPGRRQAADAGTGSGCIAAALAANNPDICLAATDFYRPALQVAVENFYHLGFIHRIFPVQCSLLNALRGPFDLICANLPYIPRNKISSLKVVQNEPVSALDGGIDGLDWIRELLAGARRCTAPGAAIFLEIEAGQGDSALECARKFLPEGEVSIYRDLAGLPRVVQILLP